MNLEDWKRLKRSGNFRRKVKKVCLDVNKKCETWQGQTAESSGGSVVFNIDEKICVDNSRSFVNVQDVNDSISSLSVNILHDTEEVKLKNQESPSSNNILQYDCESDDDIIFREEIEDSDDEDQYVTINDDDFRDNLRRWAVEFNISHTALRELNRILNEKNPFIVPADPRTLLKTNDIPVTIVPIENGQYWHNGLTKSLKKVLDNNISEDIQSISLNVNVDGLPIYKSSRHQVWPILCNIAEIPNIPPIVVGVFEGQGKPSNVDTYLRPFVEEAKHLIQSNLQIISRQKQEKCVAVNIRAFICDSPARALIKGTCNFNAKHGCLKCTVVGEYSQTSHTVTFLKTDFRKRNDEDFRSKKYGPHHKYDSPLLELPIDMINDIPVGDSLHLIDLGIMKRLLTGWRDGNFGKHITKWRATDIKKVSDFLLGCKMPKEIHRAVRTLDVLCHWKGSEFRTFLLYLSFIILEEVLSTGAYKHFMCFYCAVVICSNEQYRALLRVAEEMLKTFVDSYGSFYGKEYITSNVHNLVHVVDEVKRFGKLQDFNAYPFENRLQCIKKLIRQGNNPLAQIAKRITERTNIEAQNWSHSNLKYPYVKEKRVKTELIYILHLETYILSQQANNKYFLSTTDHVIEIESILYQNQQITILGKHVMNVVDAFSSPIKSSILNIYKCNIDDINKSEAMIFTVQDIKCKLVMITFNSMFFIPLLHTL